MVPIQFRRVTIRAKLVFTWFDTIHKILAVTMATIKLLLKRYAEERTGTPEHPDLATRKLRDMKLQISLVCAWWHKEIPGS